MSNPNSVFRCAVWSSAYLTELPYFCPQLGILNGHGLVDGRMTGNVGGVVRKRAQGKRVFVGVLALRQQFSDKVSAADVMH